MRAKTGISERVIGEWIRFYNTRRPHQALGMKTPAMAYALAALPAQKSVGRYRFSLCAGVGIAPRQREKH